MKKDIVNVEIELNSKQMSTIKMNIVDKTEMEEISEKKRIIVVFDNGQVIIAHFMRTTEEDIILKDIEGKHTFGYPLNRIIHCLVEVD